MVFGIFSIVYSWYRTRSKEIKHASEDAARVFESSLKTCEYHIQCREEMRDEIAEVLKKVTDDSVKIDLFWSMVEREFPKLLKLDT